MTIRGKFILFQVFFACLFLVFAAADYVAVRRTDYYIARVTHSHRQLESITALSLQANQYSEQIAEMLLFGERGVPELERARRQLELSFRDLERVTADEADIVQPPDEAEAREEQAMIAAMRTVSDQTHATALDLLRVQRAGQLEVARQRYLVEIEEDLDNRLQVLVDAAIADEREEVSRVDAETAKLTADLAVGVVAAALAALVAGVAAVAALSRALSRPIARLTEGAEAIGQGDLGHRIATLGGDELAVLSGHFNRMAGQLEAQREELLATQALLERKVRERTRELEEANRRLEDLDRLRVLFLADVSHELRTPLTVLRGEAEVTLRSRTSDAQDYRETLVSVVEQAAQMSRLVDDLLFLTRAEADSIRFQLSDVVLQEVFDEVLTEGRVLARERGNELRRHFPNEPLRVLADRQRLKQIALIAIDNAIKYAHPRTPVEIELRAEGEQVVAKVRNRGDAIPDEDLPYVFDRFYRGRHERTGMNGSGLGLSIAKWIVEKHGGVIGLASSPNGVTELEFRLKRAGRSQPGEMV